MIVLSRLTSLMYLINQFRLRGHVFPFLFIYIFCFATSSSAQLKWVNVDSLYQPLSSSIHIYFTKESIDTAPFRAFYLIADLKDKKLDFTDDTTLNRRLTPSKFYEKNNHPLIVVNCTFFSFSTNRNLSVVIKNGKVVAYNPANVDRKRRDSTLAKYIVERSAIGISVKRRIDIAWIYTDSAKRKAYSRQTPYKPTVIGQDVGDSRYFKYYDSIRNVLELKHDETRDRRWRMKTAVGGGPVLLQNGKIFITNEEEMMFTGKAINDKHPRTAMGYTKDRKLIILMIEGRNDVAHGATLTQEAQILKELGCWEALNLDGGGSSCMLINGKETITPSEKGVERPVPAVFVIHNK